MEMEWTGGRIRFDIDTLAGFHIGKNITPVD